MSLTARILLGFTVVALLGTYLVLGPILERVERQYLEAAEEPMVDAAEILAAWVSLEWENTGALPASMAGMFARVQTRELHVRIYDFLKTHVSMGVYVTDENGVVIFDSSKPENVGRSLAVRPDVAMTLRGQYGARSSRENPEDDSSSIMYVAAPILVQGKIVGVLSVYKPQRSMFAFIRGTSQRLEWLAGISTVAFLLIGFLFSRWITQPLERITRHAEAISRGERPPPLRMPGRHLRILGQSLEDMRDALEDRKYVESYVQTLTHEMKSPVAAIRGASELLEEKLPPDQQQRFLGNIRRETLRLQKLIEQLLALASLEKRKRLEKATEIDFHHLVERIVGRFQDQNPELRFVLEIQEIRPVRGEEFLLETAVSNLLQNAVEFSPPGGEIRVSLIADESRTILKVVDEGSGIPEYAREKVFSRFYSLPRPGTETKSSGLGLCFVLETMNLHGGSISLKNRSDRPGAEAVLAMPSSV